MVNLHPLTPHKLYPQNGARIVTLDSVTSFHRMYSLTPLTAYRPTTVFLYLRTITIEH